MAQDAIPWMFIAAALLLMVLVAGAVSVAQTARDRHRQRGTLEIVAEARNAPASAIVDAKVGR